MDGWRRCSSAGSAGWGLSPHPPRSPNAYRPVVLADLWHCHFVVACSPRGRTYGGSTTCAHAISVGSVEQPALPMAWYLGMVPQPARAVASGASSERVAAGATPPLLPLETEPGFFRRSLHEEAQGDGFPPLLLSKALTLT